jgi:hypothetical protein
VRSRRGFPRLAHRRRGSLPSHSTVEATPWRAKLRTLVTAVSFSVKDASGAQVPIFRRRDLARAPGVRPRSHRCFITLVLLSRPLGRSKRGVARRHCIAKTASAITHRITKWAIQESTTPASTLRNRDRPTDSVPVDTVAHLNFSRVPSLGSPILANGEH